MDDEMGRGTNLRKTKPRISTRIHPGRLRSLLVNVAKVEERRCFQAASVNVKTKEIQSKLVRFPVWVFVFRVHRCKTCTCTYTCKGKWPQQGTSGHQHPGFLLIIVNVKWILDVRWNLRYRFGNLNGTSSPIPFHDTRLFDVLVIISPRLTLSPVKFYFEEGKGYHIQEEDHLMQFECATPSQKNFLELFLILRLLYVIKNGVYLEINNLKFEMIFLFSVKLKN